MSRCLLSLNASCLSFLFSQRLFSIYLQINCNNYVFLHHSNNNFLGPYTTINTKATLRSLIYPKRKRWSKVWDDAVFKTQTYTERKCQHSWNGLARVWSVNKWLLICQTYITLYILFLWFFLLANTYFHSIYITKQRIARWWKCRKT